MGIPSFAGSTYITSMPYKGGTIYNVLICGSPIYEYNIFCFKNKVIKIIKFLPCDYNQRVNLYDLCLNHCDRKGLNTFLLQLIVSQDVKKI